MRSGFKIVLAAFVCVVWLAPADPGWAQEEGQQAQKTRRTHAMSEKVHRRLSKAQEAYEAEDYAAAEKFLREILEFRSLSPYERAQTHTFFGSVYIEKEDYPAAIEAFQRVIQVGGPDEIGPIHDRTLRNLAQLYMQVENYIEAVTFGRRWLESQANPVPKDYLLVAMAHFELEQWREALGYVSQAIERAQATDVEVKENWWNYLIFAHYELEEFPEALDVTRILVAGWPKKKYWLQLSGLYSTMEDEPRQRAAYWCAFDQGLLTDSRELAMMSQLFMMADIPYKAAVILQEGLDSGAIEATARNYRLLAQAWQAAREDRQALAPLRKAAESEDDAQDKSTLYVRLAESHMALSEYGQCASAVRQAVDAGDLKNEGRTYMLLGQCLFEQEKFDEAGDAFKNAARDADARKEATRWRTYLKSEVARRQALEAQLAKYDS